MIYTYDTYETADVYAYIPELVSTIIWESRSTQECGYYQVPRRVSGYQLEHQSNKYTFVSFQEASEMLREQGIPMDADQQEEDPLVARWGWLRMNDQRERTPLDGCAKRAGFERGIPIWKMLNFNFWPGTDHPVSERDGRGPERSGVVLTTHSFDPMPISYSSVMRGRCRQSITQNFPASIPKTPAISTSAIPWSLTV